MADGLPKNTEILKEIAELGGHHKLARLDTTAPFIDAFNLFANLSTSEFLSDRNDPDQIIPKDERTITDLMVDQIEFADVIIVNKIDSIDLKTKERILALAKNLNASAEVLEAKYSKINVKEIINTTMFTFEKAAMGAGWLKSLLKLTIREINGTSKMVLKPKTEEYAFLRKGRSNLADQE